LIDIELCELDSVMSLDTVDAMSQVRGTVPTSKEPVDGWHLTTAAAMPRALLTR
jgi:hypothetical protein